MYNVDEDFFQVTEPRPWMDTPEQRLLYAILERAVRDYLGNQPSEIASSAEWLFGGAEEANKAPFSFEWVCEQIGVEPERFLATVRCTAKRMNAPVVKPAVTTAELFHDKNGCGACLSVAA